MFIVKYTGPFAFIKPWSAVRDEETFSQQFLTPSLIEGIRQKLEVEKILRHRVTYKQISRQQEVVHPKAFTYKNKEYSRPRSILTRGILIDPELYLAFETNAEAEKASKQHICLARNEDIMLPEENIIEMTEEEFESIEGFELIFEDNEDSFLVGYNRFSKTEPVPMRGWLKVTDNPLKVYE